MLTVYFRPLNVEKQATVQAVTDNIWQFCRTRNDLLNSVDVLFTILHDVLQPWLKSSKYKRETVEGLLRKNKYNTCNTWRQLSSFS